jgi:hypothetical protein
MTTFYLKKITSLYFIIVNNSAKFIIFINTDYTINFIHYIKNNICIKYFYDSFYKLPEISDHSISDKVFCPGAFEWSRSGYFIKQHFIKSRMYINKIKPLLDSIILKKRLYQFFIFKLLFKDKLTNDIYQYAIRFL